MKCCLTLRHYFKAKSLMYDAQTYYTASSIRPILTKLFNLSIRTGKVPTVWKSSAVVPIPGPSPKTKLIHPAIDHANLFAISVLKILGWHISNILLSHFSNVCPISDNQRSQPQLLCSQSYTTGINTLSLELMYVQYFFDIRKAFN